MRSILFLRNSFVVLAILFLGSGQLHAELKRLLVTPTQTDPAIQTVHGPHLALYDSKAESTHRLFFFIGGTGNNATNNSTLTTTFAKWGYHVISLDYENNVITVVFAHSLDTNSFTQYRKAIIMGGSAGDKVKVAPADSILNRFQKLLVYLAAHDPEGGWDEFVTNGAPVWNRIVVAGHSQGAGHAAYLGKMFAVDRVMIFSGPQDYLDEFHKPAPWLAGASATPPARFYAFLSKNDPFNVQHQLANCAVLMQVPTPATLSVEPQAAVPGDSHIFINDVPKKNAHGSTISGQYTEVWKYMATTHDK